MRRRDVIAGLAGLTLPSVVAQRSGRARVRGAQEATPAIATREGTLAAMLAIAPDIIVGPNPPATQIAMYANPALQLATLGEPPGGRHSSAWANATYWMDFPSGVAEFAREPRWRETFGFEARQVDQALEVGEPPHRVKHLRGRFDQDELRAAWASSGYTPVDMPGAEAYSWAEEPELDVDSGVSQLGVGSFNNAALLPDGSLFFTSYLTDLNAAVAAASGEAPVLGDSTKVADVVALLDPTWATGYILTAEAIRTAAIGDESAPVSDDEAAAIATQVAVAGGSMPRPELVAIGATAGGPWPLPASDDATPRPLPPGTPSATSEIALLFADQDAAATAAPIVDARLSAGLSRVSGLPYRDFFPSWEIRLPFASPALIIRLHTSEEDRPGRILDMLERRDLLFISWDG